MNSALSLRYKEQGKGGGKQKVAVLSLGCPRNLVDAETLAARLFAKNFTVTQDIAGADTVILNTCAFIQDAKRESIEAILDLIELKEQGKIKKIIVYGCLAQRYKNLAAQLPQVDAFVGKIGLERGAARFALTPRHYAYLKICEGCLNRCSYCVIPRIKGKLESLEEKEVLARVEEFNRQKISELNIIGQDITGYGVDLCGKSSLAHLLRRIIARSADIGWIRLLYLHPLRISDELLEVVAGSKKVCKYIDLPLQHINDRILKAMGRQGNREKIFSLIRKIRRAVPGVYLRTAFIVGFPGETEKEFAELLDFVKEVKFERLGAFTYSREDGTAAYSLKNQLPEKLKQERLERLMLLQRGIAGQINSGFLGKTISALVEEKEGTGYIGRTQGDAPEVDGQVYIKSRSTLSPGKFVRVKITDTLEYDLVGEKI